MGPKCLSGKADIQAEGPACLGMARPLRSGCWTVERSGQSTAPAGTALKARLLPGRPVANAKVPHSKAHLGTELLGRDHHTVHGCEAEWILVQRVTERAIKIRKEDRSKRAYGIQCGHERVQIG
jgi:hypothetical protein